MHQRLCDLINYCRNPRTSARLPARGSAFAPSGAAAPPAPPAPLPDLAYLAPYAGRRGMQGVKVPVLLDRVAALMDEFGDGMCTPLPSAHATLEDMARAAQAPCAIVDPALAIWTRLCRDVSLWHQQSGRPLNMLRCYLTDRGRSLYHTASEKTAVFYGFRLCQREESRKICIAPGSPVAGVSPRFKISIARLAIVLFALKNPALGFTHPIAALNAAARALDARTLENDPTCEFERLLRRHYIDELGVEGISAAEHLARDLVREIFDMKPKTKKNGHEDEGWKITDLEQAADGPLVQRPAARVGPVCWEVHAPRYALWLALHKFGVRVRATATPGMCWIEGAHPSHLDEAAWAQAILAGSQPPPALVAVAVEAIIKPARAPLLTAAALRRLTDAVLARCGGWDPVRRPRGAAFYHNMIDVRQSDGANHYRRLAGAADVLRACPSALAGFLLPAHPRLPTDALRAALANPALEAHPAARAAVEVLRVDAAADGVLALDSVLLAYALVAAEAAAPAAARAALATALEIPGAGARRELCPPLAREPHAALACLLRMYSEPERHEHVDGVVALLTERQPAMLVAMTDTSAFLLPSAFCILDALIADEDWPAVEPKFLNDYPSFCFEGTNFEPKPFGSIFQACDLDLRALFEPIPMTPPKPATTGSASTGPSQ